MNERWHFCGKLFWSLIIQHRTVHISGPNIDNCCELRWVHSHCFYEGCYGAVLVGLIPALPADPSVRLWLATLQAVSDPYCQARVCVCPQHSLSNRQRSRCAAELAASWATSPTGLFWLFLPHWLLTLRKHEKPKTGVNVAQGRSNCHTNFQRWRLSENACIKVPTGRGEMEKVREFEWTGKDYR